MCSMCLAKDMRIFTDTVFNKNISNRITIYMRTWGDEQNRSFAKSII